MERLTWKGDLDKYKSAGLLNFGLNSGVDVNDAISKLTAYEDTELEPEKIVEVDKFLKENWNIPLSRLQEGMELLKLKDAGQLVVLKHGKWEFNSKNVRWGYPYLCTECGEAHNCEEPYCPNCGTKMDKEEDDEAD